MIENLLIIRIIRFLNTKESDCIKDLWSKMDEGDAENRVNFITCVKWVKKGVARQQPEKVQLSKAELVQVIKDTKKKLK